MVSISGTVLYIFLRIFASAIFLVILFETWGMLTSGPFAPVAYLLLVAVVPGSELILVAGLSALSQVFGDL